MNQDQLQYPQFEIAEQSTEFLQIINFCVSYLDTLLCNLMVMNPGTQLQKKHPDILWLQKKLLQNERKIRNLSKFHVNQAFSSFKSGRHARGTRVENMTYELSMGSSLSITPILSGIIDTSQKYETAHKVQINNIELFIKGLVHRSDRDSSDNPVLPFNLCNTLLSSIEGIGLAGRKVQDIFALFDQLLENQLTDFYGQLELGILVMSKQRKRLVDITLLDTLLMPIIDNTADDVPEDSVDILLNVVEDLSCDEEGSHVESNLKPIEYETVSHRDMDYWKRIDLLQQNGMKGAVDYQGILAVFQGELYPHLDNMLKRSYTMYADFMTQYFNNEVLSKELKFQLSRLLPGLLKIALSDPFFLRSSKHPVRRWMDSVVDFEEKFSHQNRSLTRLSRLIDLSFGLKGASLTDYGGLLIRYEKFKAKEMHRLTLLSSNRIRLDENMKYDLLQLTESISEDLILEQDMMQFLFDDYQKWLMHLAQCYGPDSTESRQAIAILKSLASLLTGVRDGTEADKEKEFESVLEYMVNTLRVLTLSNDYCESIKRMLYVEFEQSGVEQSKYG